MSTSETAVAEAEQRPRSWSERSVSIGPGLLRLPDGGYRCPVAVDFRVRCTGLLGLTEVVCRLDVSSMPTGPERLLFLYPLPAQASLSLCEVRQEEPIGTQPKVCAVDQLPPECPLPSPSESLMEIFGKESLPVFSLSLESYLEAADVARPLEVRLIFGHDLPTLDGLIRLRLPIRVAPELQAQGGTEIQVHVEIEDGDELVDEPQSSDSLSRRKVDDVFHLEGRFEASVQDLEVSFRPGRTEMPVTRLQRNEEHFLFSIFPPTSIPASPQRRDLVFAMDASENVLSGVFDVLREDLCAILRTLDENDRFALVTFGRDIDGYQGGEFCEITDAEEACQWLQSVEPKGRADIQPLLARIQSLPSQPDRQLCIFLLAAGHVGNEPAILKSLDFDQSDRRYYAVGIGPSVQQAFLRRLALLTRGRCEVAPQAHFAGALGRLLGQTRALLAEVTFEGPDGLALTDLDADSLVPARMTSLTPDGPVYCLGKGSPSSLRFRSKDETGVFFAGTVNARPTDNSALGGVWAGMRVRELLDSVRLSTGAKRKALRLECSELASSHGILVEDTVLVLETAEGVEAQLSALPYRWRRGGPAVAKVEEETTPPFDWRKGLVARDGLFKGARPSADSESSGEQSVRAGLRSRSSGSGETPGKSIRDHGKPMLERQSLSVPSPAPPVAAASSETVSPQSLQVTDALEEAEFVDVGASQAEDSRDSALSSDESVETASPSDETPADTASEDAETADVAENAGVVESVPATAEPAVLEAKTEVMVSAPLAAVSLNQVSEPVFEFVRDPLCEGKVRLDSYLGQFSSVETKMALAALAGLPVEVTRTGPDLPRILAQTVGHLEKRGYFSAAVSVLGMLLRDYSSPEVLKKMETLLVGWATSLGDDNLPEAIHILQTGRRVCPDSDLLADTVEAMWSRWGKLTQQQQDLPGVNRWTSGSEDVAPGLLFSGGHLELLRLKEQQRVMAQELSDLKSTISEQFQSLPGLLADLLDRRPGVVAVARPHQGAAVTEPTSPERKPAQSASVVELAPSSGTAQADPASGASPLESRPVDDLDISLPAVDQLAGAPASTPVEVVEAHQISLSADADSQPTDEGEASLAAAVVFAAQADASAGAQAEEALERALADGESQGLSTAPSLSPDVQTEVMPAGGGPLLSSEVAAAEGSGLDEELAEESQEALNMTRDELLELLQSEPKDNAAHRAVKQSMPDPKDQINFYRDLVRQDKDQPYHSLSLARAYREAEQTKVAVVHYQKYLRSEKDGAAYLELADAYDELGKSNLSISARKAAELHVS